MNSSDLRLVRLIPIAGEGSFTGGGGSFWDSAGVLQTAPPNTLRVTYDPADLSKAPYALVEPEARNLLRFSEQMDVSAWGGFSLRRVSNVALAPDGTMSGEGLIATTAASAHYLDQEHNGSFSNGNFYTYSVFLKANVLAYVSVEMFYAIGSTGGAKASFDLRSGVLQSKNARLFDAKIERVSNNWCRCIITGQVEHGDIYPTRLLARIALISNYGETSWGGDDTEAVLAWGAQLEVGTLATSYIKTTEAPVTRAADVVGPGAGLVYSNVPITEPLWVAGTYALGAKVRDAQNFVFESLAAGNTAALTDKTIWLPLGITNRWKAFDKAVNSQTTAPGMLTFSLKPGTVATTLMLLNMEGASVTVSQSDSGYVKTQSLVSHDVDNWYDFYYEEPVRAGDAVFTDIPPYPSSMLTVSIDNGPLESKIGACLIGKPLVLGKATASFSAGVLSYSTSTTDTFGNITMVKRSNAPRMNFDVMIPTGSEDFAYRTLRDFTDTEIGIIVGDRFSMGIGYGFLGQWDVPKSGSGRTASIEFKGLV